MGREDWCGPRRKALANALTEIMKCARATPEPMTPRCQKELRNLQHAVEQYKYHACEPAIGDISQRGVQPKFYEL